MRKTIKSVPLLLAISSCLVLIAACRTSANTGPSQQKCSFAVVADPRRAGDTWVNALSEIRDMKAAKGSLVSPAELIVVAGDMDPLKSRYEDYLKVFAVTNTRPILLPVIGNHEFEDGGSHFRYVRDVLIPSVTNAIRRDGTECDYYLDHKNVRIIAIDSYTTLGKNGVINDKGREWVEKVIEDAPSSIDHIFISFHEPAFPRFRHLKDSLNSNPKQRNAFWQMLLKHKDRVRALLVGHTHSYYRMRVLDPAGAAVNNPKVFPDEEGGIYQIDAGAAGNGNVSTIVQIQTEGKSVLFRVIQAEPGANKSFKEVDKWSITP